MSLIKHNLLCLYSKEKILFLKNVVTNLIYLANEHSYYDENSTLFILKVQCKSTLHRYNFFYVLFRNQK